MTTFKSITILIAEDDQDDYLLMKKAMEQTKIVNELHWVKDGEELLDYLLHRGSYQDHKNSPKPVLILLDLNMPKVDGREALKQIKQNENLRMIPVVILTTSKRDEDVVQSYNLGVNSFIRKPEDFSKFIDIIRDVSHYWFDIVELPK